MAQNNAGAPKQFCIRISKELMELVSEIQDSRRHTKQVTNACRHRGGRHQLPRQPSGERGCHQRQMPRIPDR